MIKLLKRKWAFVLHIKLNRNNITREEKTFVIWINEKWIFYKIDYFIN
jgi:hypothetical protein